MRRPLPILALATALFTLTAGCGNGERDTEFDCDDHGQCLDDEACLGEVCVDEPDPGDECPESEGVDYEGLFCEDATWIPAPADLVFTDQPPEETTAGIGFDVGVELIDDDGEPTGVEGVDMTLELTQIDFAGGEATVTAATDADGLATFEPTVETTGTDLVLTATADHDLLTDVEITSNTFDVVAEADADHSSITGESGVPADGETAADVEIELADEFGNPVVGVVPDFEATGEGNDYEDCTETDEDGVADCAMTSTEAGDKTLEVTDPVDVTGETIEFELACVDAEDFGGGDGTADDPWRLCEAEHLNELADDSSVFDDHFALGEDIDLAGVANFDVVGDDTDPFVGTFEGNGHTVDNLTIDADDTPDVGLFGVIGDDGLVKDLTVENADVTGETRVGSLAGTNDGTIDDSHAAATVVSDDQTAGGLVGANHGTIQDGSAEGHVEASNGYGGGFVGRNSDGAQIHDSAATGDVETLGMNAGGFAGENDDATITGSYATGDVSGEAGVTSLGGFVGNNEDGAQIEDSYATGDLDGNIESVGGFVGDNRQDTRIETCYATGTADVDDQANVAGGFAGNNVHVIEESYWDTDTSDNTEGVDISSSAEENDVTGLETDEFDDDTNFDGFDFGDTWVIDEAPDGQQRPVLQWQ